MPDREKIIKAVEYLNWYFTQDDGMADKNATKAWEVLLREHEPVTMKPYYFNYVCSGCESEIDGEFIDYTGGKIKFCPECGRRVKWDDTE